MPFTFEADHGELAPGQHNDVEIVEAVPGVNSKGNENLRVVFENRDGAQIADWLVALPQVKWRWKALWDAAGADLRVDEDGRVLFDEADLIGRRVAIDVVEDEWQGVVRPKVKEVFARVPSSDVPGDDGSGFQHREPDDGEEVPW